MFLIIPTSTSIPHLSQPDLTRGRRILHVNWKSWSSKKGCAKTEGDRWRDHCLYSLNGGKDKTVPGLLMIWINLIYQYINKQA